MQIKNETANGNLVPERTFLFSLAHLVFDFRTDLHFNDLTFGNFFGHKRPNGKVLEKTATFLGFGWSLTVTYCFWSFRGFRFPVSRSFHRYHSWVSETW